MLKLYLRYQMKSRAAFAPVIFVFFTVYHFLIPGMDMSRIGIFFLQGLFYDAIRRNSINITLARVTNFPLQRMLWLQNISYFITFNFWFIISQIIVVTWAHSLIAHEFKSLLRFECLLLVATIIGNVISNSDYVTIKSKFWQYTSASFVFSTCYAIAATFLRILWHFTESYLALLMVIIALAIVWQVELRTEKNIKFFRYMIN